jgi:hypothetical protein
MLGGGDAEGYLCPACFPLATLYIASYQTKKGPRLIGALFYINIGHVTIFFFLTINLLRL